MARKIFNELTLYGIAGIFLSLTAFGLYLYDRFETEGQLRDKVEARINKDFHEQVKKVEKDAPGVLIEFDEHRELFLDKDPASINLVFNRDSVLVGWNNSEHLPNYDVIQTLCRYPDHFHVEGKNRIYYLIRNEDDKHILISLIPLRIEYQVRNRFLPGKVFLGRYQNRPELRKHAGDVDVFLTQQEEGITVFDPDGNFVFSFVLRDMEIFKRFNRQLVLIFGFLGILFLLLSFRSWLRGKLSPALAKDIFLGMLIILRIVLIQFGLPNSYVETDFFSPMVLAVNTWTPSLGDLTLNVLLFFLICYYLARYYHRKISTFYSWTLSRPGLAWTLNGVMLFVSSLLVFSYFFVFEQITRNSQINIDFTNVFKLDFYSYVLFVNLGVILIGLLIVLIQLLRFNVHFVRHPNKKPNLLRLLASIVLLGVFAAGVGRLDPMVSGSIGLTLVFVVVILFRIRHNTRFRLDFPNFLLIMLLFSILTSVNVKEAINRNMIEEMQQIALRESDPHDLIVETLFDRVHKKIMKEAPQATNDEIGEDVGAYLQENYFQSEFKGYELRVFVYQDDSVRIDKDTTHKPYLPAGSGDLSLSDISGGGGEPTLADSLFLVPYFQNFYEYIYVGQFQVPFRAMGMLTVQVELYPTQVDVNRLYPKLLLDEKVGFSSLFIPGYDYAIYRNDLLFRKSSGHPFLLYYKGPKEIEVNQSINRVEKEDECYYYRFSRDKIIHVRTATMTFFEQTNIFSLIFYLYVIFFLILMLPWLVFNKLRNRGGIFDFTIRTKIQVFLLALSTLPLLFFLFFLSPYVKKRFIKDISLAMHNETKQVAELVRGDYQNFLSAQQAGVDLDANINQSLREIEKTIVHDINIFDKNGRLILSTRPNIYQLGLTSEYLNPEVFARFQKGKVSDMMLEDRIGNLDFISGYYPLMTDDKRIIGFLNIPYLTRQDLVTEQILGLLAFLMDIYFIVFLAIGFLAILVSNSITRPLNLLRQKLADTTLGRTNEPIHWDSSDEIGQIILSYNRMLKQLSESEKKLAATERDLAWKEMARQVAHEIKNPLTPMKLSIQHLVRAWKKDDPKKEKLFEKVTNTLLVQVDSLKNIANSFSEFAKMPEPIKSTFDLVTVVKEVTTLYSTDEKVQMNLDLLDGEFMIHSDRDQLSRSFNNLIKNGKEALENGEGALSVKMKRLPNGFAQVAIIDNGRGIPEDIRERIFTPKFSTKNSGMGLGLAIVKKIIEGSGGTIYFESKTGEGTTFYIELPEAETA